jgi:ABC-2 type transport system permease protein
LSALGEQLGSGTRLSSDPPPGRAITGPSALGGDARRFLHLTLTLAATEFKLRFFGSVLGYFWQLARPLMLFGVLYFVFTEFVRIGGLVPFYPVVLITNIVLFTFFVEGTIGSVSSVIDREGLVRKIQFPRMAIPSSVVLTASFNLALNLLVVLVFILASGVRPTLSWLQAPFLIGALMLLTLGLAMLLSSLYVRYRDVRPIWEVIAQAMLYASPVIWTIETLDKAEWVKNILMCSPVATILQQMRHAVIDPTAPSAAEAIGGAPRLLIPAGITLALVVVGFWKFNREAPRIAEDL